MYVKTGNTSDNADKPREGYIDETITLKELERQALSIQGAHFRAFISVSVNTIRVTEGNGVSEYTAKSSNCMSDKQNRDKNIQTAVQFNRTLEQVIPRHRDLENSKKLGEVLETEESGQFSMFLTRSMDKTLASTNGVPKLIG